MSMIRTRTGHVRINVRSRKEICINETMEMPVETTLASLRLFLRKTFPYLPWAFKFETEKKVTIDISLEKRILVSALCPTVYLYPYIPKYPKGQDPATLLAEKAAALNGGTAPSPLANKLKKLEKKRRGLGSPGKPGESLVGMGMNGESGFTYNQGEEEDGEVEDGLIPLHVRERVLDEWRDNRIAYMQAIQFNSQGTEEEERTGIPEKFLKVLRSSGLEQLIGSLDINEFRRINAYELRKGAVPRVSYNDETEFRRFAMRSTVIQALAPKALAIQQKARSNLAKQKVSIKRQEILFMKQEEERKKREMAEQAELLSGSSENLNKFKVGSDVFARVDSDGDLLPARITAIHNVSNSSSTRNATIELTDLFFYHGEEAKGVPLNTLLDNSNLMGVPESFITKKSTVERTTSFDKDVNKEEDRMEKSGNGIIYVPDNKIKSEESQNNRTDRPYSMIPNTSPNMRAYRSKGKAKPIKNELMKTIELDAMQAANNNSVFLDTYAPSPTLKALKSEGRGSAFSVLQPELDSTKLESKIEYDESEVGRKTAEAKADAKVKELAEREKGLEEQQRIENRELARNAATPLSIASDMASVYLEAGKAIICRPGTPIGTALETSMTALEITKKVNEQSVANLIRRLE